MSATEYKYEMFFELSPDLMCIAGFDGYFKKINPAVAKTLGYTFEELYARPINDFVHPDDQDITARVRGELVRSKPLHHFENKYLTKGGETIWLTWTSMPMHEDNLIFAVAKNITHKKKVEEDRNLMLANLTRINKDLIKLNYATSDELKSPVHSLLALFDLLDLSKINDPETLQLLEVVQFVSDKLRKSLNDHLELLTLKGKENTTTRETDLQECLDEVLQAIAAIIHSSHAQFTVDFSKLPKVWFDPAWLKSILLNLITNAIKHARPDVLPVITIFSQINEGSKQLIISDNGSGFDARKTMQEISDFPVRFQKDPASKGVGLYLVNSQVTALGGKLKIESQENQGTRVTITFK